LFYFLPAEKVKAGYQTGLWYHVFSNTESGVPNPHGDLAVVSEKPVNSAGQEARLENLAGSLSLDPATAPASVSPPHPGSGVIKAPPLRELCSKYGIQFKKGLGQNLLLDDNINAIMVAAADLQPGDRVVEVGAGLGALTRRLAAAPVSVLAVEIDRAFMPCLEDQFGHLENVRLFRGDILNHDLGDLVREHLPGSGSLKMVSNLPYYITTPVLFHFLESPIPFSRLVVMVQLEVGERLAAGPGTAEYGALTIAANLYARVDMVRRVPASCFVPRPKVDSAIVRLRLREKPLYDDLHPRQIMRVVRAAFSRRRKTLRNALGALTGPRLDRAAITRWIESAGIEPERRPETLSLDEFAQLARTLTQMDREEGRHE